MFDLLTGVSSLESPAGADSKLLDLANGLRVHAYRSRQRRLLVLAGEMAWCRQRASVVADMTELNRVVWVTSADMAEEEAVQSTSVQHLLGQETNAVVFDAFSGFDPDAFGAICGTICAGGLLILLCPPLTEWEHFNDPASERIAISPYTYKDISGRFIRRLVGIVRNDADVTIVEQDLPVPTIDPDVVVIDENLTEEINDTNSNSDFRTRDQQIAVEAIEHVLHGHRRRPAVLVSDRGRGKSAALGIAAARLLLEKNSKTQTSSDGSKKSLSIIVTAPRLAAVESLFFHARRILQRELPQDISENKIADNELRFHESSIRFIAPDVLCSMQEPADLVLVDEAAAIPSSMLAVLLNKYSRIVFATTVHGYEGTGRGFAVRFRKTLDEKAPGWKEVNLQTPIRWAENDPLEKLVFRSLLLDAEISADKNVLVDNLDKLSVECLDRDALVNDEETLSQLFSLLVVAHYRTTPNDLRNLLDGPGISVYVMRLSHGGKNHVVATALVSREGEFTEELADAVFNGQRRPHGHLIPQSLVVHAGIKGAAPLRFSRIMRIAVHPALQRKGLGGKLVQAIKDKEQHLGSGMIGVSFGATTDLIHFWQTQSLFPVRVGFRRDHASGEHSVMMLKSLNDSGESIYQLARSRYLSDLSSWLSDSLNKLDCEVAAALLYSSESLTKPGQQDKETLKAFSKGARSYDDSSAALWRQSVNGLMVSGNNLSKPAKLLLIAKVLQKRSWQEVSTLCHLNGRAEVVNELRLAAAQLLLMSDKVN